MGFLRLVLHVTLGLLFCMLAGASRAAAQGTTVLFLDSQPGDYIGQGQLYTYTPADTPFRIERNGDTGVSVVVQSANFSIAWTARFAARRGERLQVGSYDGRRSAGSPLGGLDIGGQARGCNTALGRFDVLEILYAPDGSVTRFAADFEQHCEGRDAALFGAVRYNSNVASTAPFGGIRGYSLTLVPDPHGTISGSGLLCGAGSTSCSTTFASPVDVALVATTGPGYVFAGWIGTCTGDAATSVRVNTLATCAARFEPVDSTAALYRHHVRQHAGRDGWRRKAPLGRSLHRGDRANPVRARPHPQPGGHRPRQSVGRHHVDDRSP